MSTSNSTTRAPAGAGASTSAQPGESYFETQRTLLVGEIAISLEHVLQNINKLNRSLEGVIALGNEFSSVEALWSQFESVMGKDPDADTEASKNEDDEEEQATELNSENGGRQ